MNQEQFESKDTAAKTLTIIGFIALIIFGVWLAVQAVRYIPTAFSSLASLADSVYSGGKARTLTVSQEKNIVNVGESFTIMWTDLKRDGTYGFTYQCADGVSLEIRRAGGDVRTLACGELLSLPDGNDSIDVMIESEKNRFVDVPFTLTFTGLGESQVLFEQQGKITVVNATIPQSNEVAGGVLGAETSIPNEAVAPTVEPTAPAPTPKPVTPVPKPVQQEYSYSYIPQSNPNGFIDLQVLYLGSGTLSVNVFTASPTVDNDLRGAIRFEVKNIGTKTSDTWKFSAKLPTGETYDSSSQEPLKPNESAAMTIAFESPSTGTKAIQVTVTGGNDSQSTNNSFINSVVIVD
jgi:hypothetical protein